MALPIPRMLVYTPGGAGLSPDNPMPTGFGINLFDDSIHPDNLPLSPNWSIAAIRPAGAFVAPLVITGSHGSPASVNLLPDLKPGISRAEIDIRLLVKSASGSAEIIRTIHVRPKGATSSPPSQPSPSPPPSPSGPVTGSVTWSAPVESGVAIRRVGDPSGASIRITGPAGVTVRVRNRRVGGGVIADVPVTIPVSGVWSVDDRTPVPSSYPPADYEVVLVDPSGYESVIGRFRIVSASGSGGPAGGDQPPIYVGGQNPPAEVPGSPALPPPPDGGGGGGGGGGGFADPGSPPPSDLDRWLTGLGPVTDEPAPAPAPQSPAGTGTGTPENWMWLAGAGLAALLLLRR